MSATDELRKLLDERGVEYETYTEPLTGIEHVKWNFNEHGSADFNIEFGAPWLTMYGEISGPAQAIEATLGRGECHVYLDGNENYKAYRCDACGMQAVRWGAYCPCCGRRVVEVVEG